MSTWRVASAALFGEADLNMKKGRTPSTKVQGIRANLIWKQKGKDHLVK